MFHYKVINVKYNHEHKGWDTRLESALNYQAGLGYRIVSVNDSAGAVTVIMEGKVVETPQVVPPTNLTGD